MHSTRSFQRLVRTIKAAWHAECDDKGGQVLTVDMGGCLVSACWRRPDRNEAAANFWSHVTETTQNAQARCIPWIGLGDWNHTPDEMWMCATGYAFDCAVKARDDSFQPSRWNGRCVDFAVSTHAGLLSTPMYWTDVLSDHQVYGVNLTIRCEEASNFYMAPTRSYLKPEGVSADVWRKTISRHWMQTSPIPATTTEEEWYSFNAAVEECLCSAATDHGCRRTERRRPKGTAPWTVCATDYTCRAANLSTFPARSTRKLLGRIREYRRQILLEKEDPALLRHIRRTWPECHRFSSRFQAEQHLQQQLDMMRASLKKANMQQWRARMNKQGRAATKWLKAKPALIPHSILRADGSKTTCATDSLQELSAFWRRVWDRPISNDVHQSLQSQVGAPPEHGPATCDIFPSAAALLAKARQSADGAPGPDGWAGGEVEHWCTEMWEVYLQLLHRWAARDQWPRSWQHMRQVHIRKNDLIYEGDAVPANALRPISVQSILVRILGSAFVSQPEVRRWVQSKVPECCHGALSPRYVATAWSVLAEAVEQKQIIASLDFEKCLDHVFPPLAVGTLRSKGLSPVWCSLVNHIWQHQKDGFNLGGQRQPAPTECRLLYLKVMLYHH